MFLQEHSYVPYCTYMYVQHPVNELFAVTWRDYQARQGRPSRERDKVGPNTIRNFWRLMKRTRHGT